MEVDLTNQERQRYARHLSLDEIGISGQKKIKAAKVLIVGVGGLGCPSALYLAAAGVGTIGLVENDVIEESNLQRQILFGNNDLGREKVEVAAERLEVLCPDIDIKKFSVRLNSNNAAEIISQFDIVIDGTDNLASKYLINDVCYLIEKPLIYASISQFEGQLAIFNQAATDNAINYRDLFPFPPPLHLAPSCVDGGVIGVLPGLFGCMQANETIKLICDIPSGLSGKLLRMDSITMEINICKISRNQGNPLRRLGFSLSDISETLVESTADTFTRLSIDMFIDWLTSNDLFQFIDVRSDIERGQVSFGGKHISLDQIEVAIAQVRVDLPVVFYCATGKRSEQACNLMIDRGLNGSFYSLAGGIANLSAQVKTAAEIVVRFDQYGVLITQ
jgi:molybdopterin/thiamine biosynthesis adenylyltransferase/rhodanese-related sulfurtransferase